ncbi:MAG: pseudouridine synthase [Caldicoprobacterales bacterium]|jgi:23S rRNA pseudouridine2605 synthase|nr:rRNA pseudouridine synthase [Clostridiales bacterium]
MRLQKYMALCGVGSRRKSEDLIRQGRVYLNGKQVVEMGTLVDPRNDKVLLDQKQILIPVEDKIYILLNKPSGTITSVKDPQGRETVLDRIGWKGSRIYPVGRLDYETEGALILTNDGDFAFALTHPKYQVEKEYYCIVKGSPKSKAVNRLRQGVNIGDFVTSPAEIKYMGSKNGNAEFRLVIHEGKNRQVRRMFEAVGHPVLYLKRERIGSITLDKLKPGFWRYLSKEEIIELVDSIGGTYKNGSF